jgi:hypothetical protein
VNGDFRDTSGYWNPGQPGAVITGGPLTAFSNQRLRWLVPDLAKLYANFGVCDTPADYLLAVEVPLSAAGDLNAIWH